MNNHRGAQRRKVAEDFIFGTRVQQAARVQVFCEGAEVGNFGHFLPREMSERQSLTKHGAIQIAPAVRPVKVNIIILSCEVA